MILKTTLFDYQIVGVDKLLPIKIGALYMEMGTGKTRTALEIAQRRLLAGRIDQVLWLCPCAIQREIAADIDKHADDWHEIIRIRGIESLSASIRLNAELLNYVEAGRTMIVVDESSLVKNGLALRTQNTLRIAQKCPYRMILNGTPISKNEADLFSQWQILDWRVLGYRSFWAFAKNHIEYDEKQKGRIRRCLNVDYLSEKIAPYTYQVLKADILKLPKKDYDDKTFHMTTEQSRHYWEVVEEYMPDFDEEDIPAFVYRMFTACMQVTSGRRILLGNRKAPLKTEPMFENKYDNPRLETLLAIIENSDAKTIIWCHYTHEVQDVAEALREIYGDGSVVMRYGDMPQKKRDEALTHFREDARFLVGNKACSAHGLNLQHCHRMIYYSNDWDWATRVQSEDRVHRVGQDHEIKIIDIVASDSIDKRVLRSLYRKENLADELNSEIKAATGDKEAILRRIMGGMVDE